MSKTSNLSVVPDAENKSQEKPTTQTIPFGIKAQYVKDFSFENPYAHEVMSKTNEKPDMNVTVNVNAKPLSENNYEVALQVNVKAKYGNKTAFLIELSYAGLFYIEEKKANILNLLLLVECPRLLFPYARNIISDTTRDGGFPPLFLQPIDFADLYKKKLQSLAQNQAKKEEKVENKEVKTEEKSDRKASSTVH